MAIEPLLPDSVDKGIDTIVSLDQVVVTVLRLVGEPAQLRCAAS
jgi:hypothetical protein